MHETEILHITDTLQYIPKQLSFPNTKTEDYFQQAISYILTIIQDLLKTLPFLSYVYATKNAFNKISHILQQSKYQLRLPILPLPPMLTQVLTPIPL